MSNVYMKLQTVRAELSKTELTKTGENKHLKFKYFELGDFLPAITELCAKNKICSIINFGTKLATLKIIDCEKDGSIIRFSTPIEKAKLMGSPSPVQELGATQTYIRRYLYMNAFEVVDTDVVDAQPQDKAPNRKIADIDLREECKNNIVALFDIKDNNSYLAKLKELTSFEDKEGKVIEGIEVLAKASDKRVQVLHGKLKKLLEDKKCIKN